MGNRFARKKTLECKVGRDSSEKVHETVGKRVWERGEKKISQSEDTQGDDDDGVRKYLVSAPSNDDDDEIGVDQTRHEGVDEGARDERDIPSAGDQDGMMGAENPGYDMEEHDWFGAGSVGWEARMNNVRCKRRSWARAEGRSICYQ